MEKTNYVEYPTLKDYLEKHESFDLTKVEKFFRKDIEDTLEAKHNYILNHFRYNTMNSWNRVTNFANNVKIHSLDIPENLQDTMYEFVNLEETYESLNDVIDIFAKYYNYKYQIGFNGRSGGYLVLYLGDIVTNKDREGNEKNHAISYPGKSIHVDEDINEMLGDIEDIFSLVSDFNLLCDLMRFDFIQTLSNNEIIDEEIMVPKIIKTLRHNSIESEQKEN